MHVLVPILCTTKHQISGHGKVLQLSQENVSIVFGERGVYLWQW